MLAQKKTIKVLMFLLPAIVSLIAYTAYHEMLFSKPPCLINCDHPGMFSDNEKIKKWLAYLESLRDDTFSSKPRSKRPYPTSLDLAFLEDKIHLASNDSDYINRYQQIISDLNTPNVVKSGNPTEEYVGLPEKVAPLAYLGSDQDPNNQVFATLPADESGSAPFNQPRSVPYYVPTGSGPGFFAGGGGNPNNNEGGSQGGGSDGSNPNNGGGPGTGTPGGGIVTPSGPGGNGNTTGGGNPISTVPLPSAGLLIAGLVLILATIRLKTAQQ